MRKLSDTRNCRVAVNYTAGEMTALEKKTKDAGYAAVSSYIRLLSLNKPIRVYMRNASFDAFVGEAVRLRKEIASIRAQYQSGPLPAVELTAIHEQVFEIMIKIYQLCLSTYSKRPASDLPSGIMS